MTVVKLHPDTRPAPGMVAGYEEWATRPIPVDMLSAAPGCPETAAEALPVLAAAGVPEAVLEAATGLRAGSLREWRELPPSTLYSTCPRSVADAVAQSGALAEAQLSAVLHRRAASGDARAAQWLLERRRPERWAPASDDALREARAEGAASERARLTRAGWTPPQSADGLQLPIKE